MSDELTQLRAEVAALREECTGLRREFHRFQHLFGFYPDKPHMGSSQYMIVDAECVGLRFGGTEKPIPILLRAHEENAEITLHDDENRCRGRLGIDQTGVRLEIRNAEGNVVVALGEAKDGSGTLYVADAAGRPRTSLRVNDDGGVVNVVDENGKALAVLCSGEGGGNVFVATNRQKMAVTMKATEGGGHVAVHEPGGQLMGFLVASSTMGSVAVYGPQGAIAASMGGGEEGGVVAFYDVEGKSKAVLP